MTPQAPGRRNDVRWAWLLAGTVALIGYALVVAPYERRLQAVEFHAHELYDLANRNERMYRERQTLLAAQTRVESDLKRLAGTNSSGKATLSTLELLRREAAWHHALVTGVTPADSNDAVDSGAQAIDIKLHGAYRDILRIVADLSRHDLLIEVGDAELAAAPSDLGSAPDVDATVHATVFHDLTALMKEKDHGIR